MVGKPGIRISAAPKISLNFVLSIQTNMRTKELALLASIALASAIDAYAQNTPDTTQKKPKKYQAIAPATIPFGKEAFGAAKNTNIRWLGMAGFLVNSHGTTLMIDPLLEGYDMPLAREFPIKPKEVPHLDAVLATHSDNDHYSVATFKDLAPVTKEFHSTVFVDSLMKNEGLPSFGHFIGESFRVGGVSVRLTLADHAWQNNFPQPGQRYYEPGDACGFWLDTPDGSIWAPGDSRFMQEQLRMPTPDAILFDYSEDAAFHSGLEGAVKIANAYPHTPLILGHWGFVDAPDFIPFNGDPKKLAARVVNPERIIVLAPGQPFTLKRLKSNKK
jgi:L-ascorbate metabolism protein UlaG (beta-lactamase superfamily)